MWRSPGLRKRRRSVRSVEKIGAGEQPAAAGDDVFFDEDDFLSGTIFGSSDNSTTKGSNRTAAGMSESLSLFQSIHVLQADEHLNETSAGQHIFHISSYHSQVQLVSGHINTIALVFPFAVY